MLLYRNFKGFTSSVPGTGGRDQIRISYYVTGRGEPAASVSSPHRDSHAAQSPVTVGNGGFLPREVAGRGATGAVWV